MRDLIKPVSILIFLLFSCNNNSNNNSKVIYVNELDSIKLHGENIRIKGIYRPSSIFILDTFLIIVSLDNEYCLHIFNANTFELIKKYGRKGRGPDEFMDPVLTWQRIADTHDGKTLLIYDSKRRRLSEINIMDLLSDSKKGIKSEVLPKEMINVSNIIFVKDSVALFSHSNEGNPGRFGLYNFKSHKTAFSPYLPDLGFKVHPNNFYPLYNTSGACVDLQKQRFVAFPCLLGELDFFDLSGNYFQSTIIERVDEIKNAKYEKLIFETPGVRYYMTDLQSFNDKIYTLCTILIYPDLNNRPISEIYVFDWDGNPIKKYVLDREIFPFSYDARNNRFIGFSNYDEEYPFISYELNNK
jgi:hypothetical protein